MPRLKKNIIGTKEFGSKIDITDPCYSRDVLCRKNDIQIEPGKYTCIAWTQTKRKKCESEVRPDTRVMIAGIYKDGIIPEQKDLVEIGYIAVDAGLAGFFENKPDYNNEEWNDFCEKIKTGNAWIDKYGFFTSSGYGDGVYPVFTYKQNGKITVLEIEF